MDDSLLAQFHSVFSVTGDVNAPTRPHPAFSSLFKKKRGGYGEQEARRRRLLEEQRTRRRNHIDYVRKIADGEEWEEEMEEGDDADETDSGDVTKKTVRTVHPYKHQLMLSEWLVDVPEDFSENWLMTVCPIGKRALVIANKGTTLAFSRSGACINCFPSLLPGGCMARYNSSRDYCVLDCILEQRSRTFHVLDLLCWLGHGITDSDREFRSYWVQVKLNETPEAGVKSRRNPFIFSPLKSFSCSQDPAAGDSMAHVLSKSWPVQVDGLLFFHRHGHYQRGRRTPLATWLKPHMVEKILGIPVSEDFLTCAPQMSDPLAKSAKPSQPPQSVMEEEDGDGDGAGREDEVKMMTASEDAKTDTT